MKTYVLYHANCWDGFCAAWVARSALRGEVEFVPVQYGEPPPEIAPKSRLYILDFSYSREQLFRWWTPGPNAVEQLVVLDHHKTAQEELAHFDDHCLANGMDCPHIIFDMEKSGCRLAWEHFYGKSGIRCPAIIDYIEDRDLWRWKSLASREVNAAIRSYPMDFDLMSKWSKYEHPADYFRSEGEAILRREKQIVDEHVKHAVVKRIGSHDVPTVNTTVLFSEIAGELAKGQPFGACYFVDAEGVQVWSLRSDENGIDVSAVAKQFGGGGHKRAAGFKGSIG